MLKLLYQALAWLSLLLAILGIALPLLPTVPFLLVSAWGFSRSSPRFEHWLLNHPKFGPPIIDWRRDGVISLKAKRMATLFVGISLVIMLLNDMPLTLRLVAISCLSAVLVFLWSRPSQAPAQKQQRAAKPKDSQHADSD
ncbi:YbaN family protein [Aliagarivorans marinus]|uniref:YbaN family protein n=1 Tax=Aliagarivorans marinus TaxID=561965 RepID=UPI00041FC87C|nr:YbaN family protein [Aliagarivorans marinus]